MYPVVVALSTAIFCALVSESIIWYLIYRHEEYKKLCKDYEEGQEKLDALKEK